MKKKQQLAQKLSTFIQNFVILDHENHRILLVNFLRLLGIPMLFIFVIYDFSRGALLEGFFDIVILSILVLSTPILKRIQNQLILFRIVIALLVINFSFVIYANPKFYIATLWMFLLPIIISFLLGTKEGAVWILLSYLASLIALQVSEHRATIPTDFFIRFTITYLLLGVLSLIVESVRARAHYLLYEKQRELETLNKILYEASLRDSLTGFYNRAFLSAPLEKILGSPARCPGYFRLREIRRTHHRWWPHPHRYERARHYKTSRRLTRKNLYRFVLERVTIPGLLI